MKVDFKKKGCKDGKWILYINIAISQDEARENSSLTINLTDPPKSKDNQLSILRQEFYDYCAKYSKADMRIVKACKEKFVKFLDSEDKYSELDKSFCEEFWNYLTDSLHGNTPANYFKKFRTFLDYMVEKGIIQSNPTKLLKLHKYHVKRSEQFHRCLEPSINGVFLETFHAEEGKLLYPAVERYLVFVFPHQ